MDDCSSGFCIRATTRGGGGGTGTKCGRWNPTAEQVKVLTELFRSGLRTPSTDQIQKISSQLSFYGKIESKNVFYWFQNHKARERQNRRRVLVDEGSEAVFNSEHDHQRNNPIKFSSSPNKLCGEIEHQIRSDHHSAERVVETLQLFPLNSLTETDSEKLRQFAEDYKENYKAYDFNKSVVGTEMEIPTLDLRLSFFN